MRVPDPVLIAATVGDEAELQQPGLDDLHGLRVDILQRRPRLAALIAFLLRLQHDPVDILLQRRERAADRIGARDVARHVAVVAGGVDEQEIAGLHLPVAVGVVQDRRVRSAADDRRIAPRRRRRGRGARPRSRPSPRTRTRPAAPRACRPAARRSRSRGSCTSTLRSYGVFTVRRSSNTGVTLTLSKPTKRSRICCANCSGGGGGSASAASRVVDERERRAVRRERVEESRRLLRGMIGAEAAAGSASPLMNGSNWLAVNTTSMPVRARASSAVRTRPRQCSCAGSLSLTNRISRRVSVAGHQHQDRAVLRDAGQVVEVAVLAVLVVDVERVALGRRAPEDEHRLRAEALHDARAPGRQVVAELAGVRRWPRDKSNAQNERADAQRTRRTRRLNWSVRGRPLRPPWWTSLHHRLDQLPGIHAVVGIERAFERAHQVEGAVRARPRGTSSCRCRRRARRCRCRRGAAPASPGAR